MRDRYDVEVATARQFEKRKNFTAAAIHWLGAAHTTSDALDRVEALTEAKRCTDQAFESAVVAANAAGHPWREIAPYAHIPWQTLHRRYSHRLRSKASKRR